MSIASVTDGQVQGTGASTKEAEVRPTGTSSLDKDAFLQLLVTQMQYQDPLEPTSNTEYISQLATFSELEEMQNLTANMELQRASSLVGQEVILKVTGTTGNTEYIRGPVDYVQLENGEAKLSVNGKLYSLDDLDSVADKEYIEASDKAYAFMTSITKLPTVANLTIKDKDKIDEMWAEYEEMSEYELSFLDKTVRDAVEAYKEKMDELKLLNGDKEEPDVEEPDVEKPGTTE